MDFSSEVKNISKLAEFATVIAMRNQPCIGAQVNSPVSRMCRGSSLSMTPRLELSRSNILCFKRRVGSLDERLPAGANSLRVAAWAGLQDSAPRAALLSIHARVEETSSKSWEHHSLVQLWGPRFNDYIVTARDLAVFPLGRLPVEAVKRARARDTADRLHAFLKGRRMPFGQAGHCDGSAAKQSPIRCADWHRPPALGRRAPACRLDSACP